jgi:REP element-mobilizing transposase RayT
MIKFDHQTQFVTITCLNWKPFLQNDYHKQIIVEALKCRVAKDEISIYCYVIMPNHMHFLWQLHDGIIREDFQRDFLKFTARSILKFMKMNDDPLHCDTIVQTSDRKHQVWERNALRVDIFSEKVFRQKMYTFITILLLKDGSWRASRKIINTVVQDIISRASTHVEL